MRKNTLNFLIDLATLLAILSMIGTGLILKYSLPPGSGGRGLVLWGLGRHDWGDVHFWIAVSLGALLVAHIVLHWPWVVGTIRRLTNRTGTRTGRPASTLLNVSCIAFFVVIAGAAAGFTLFANDNVSASVARAQEHDREHAQARVDTPGIGLAPAAGNPATEECDHGSSHLRGSMTLAEVERETGLTVTAVLALLELPQGTSPQERLGPLCRTYGLSMSTARSIISEHAVTPRP
ncbi:MAG: DUF4405 domain-containing protein [Planctomycetota bacterium]|jgi:hypothetical protein